VRKIVSFATDQNFINKALQHADRESHAVYLNPNSYPYPHKAFLSVLAFGMWKELNVDTNPTFESLKLFLNEHKDWTFGYFSYDLKNELEKLNSKNTDSLNFPVLSFFIPKHILFFSEHFTEIHSLEDPEKLFESIQKEETKTISYPSEKINIEQRISKNDYIHKVKKLQELILQGDIYEINFCMEFFIQNITLNPFNTYQVLNSISPMPFSCYLKLNHQYLLCASPERFLKKEKQTLISQPIKGTSKREMDTEKDETIRLGLENSQKERAENIMIVDLVRNDLSYCAKAGSVKVEELCRVYSFPLVHQMISTITAEADTKYHAVDIIRKAFPMGSMTGAPKIKAMQLIEEYEETLRGLFSGAVGYFTPEMDFDFNVVIRSILYNQHKKYLSFQAGSAITYNADAEKEYEECLIKTAAIRKAITLD
jgi:para-aminobenzoate synthetase component 1